MTAFLVPANAMLTVELGHLADMLDATKQAKNVSQLAKHYKSVITNAIWNTTVSAVQLTRTGQYLDGELVG